MKYIYKIAIVASSFVIVIFILFLLNHKPVFAPEISDSIFRELKINGKIINVEIADTEVKRVQGLSGRQSLAKNSGMLFIFDTPDYYSFWMKDMNFSLDFVWISGNEIVEITRNVKPEDYQPASARQSSLGGPPNTLFSKNKIDKVLEINAGEADKLGLQEGDILEF